jgi:hypothetical protein
MARQGFSEDGIEAHLHNPGATYIELVEIPDIDQGRFGEGRVHMRLRTLEKLVQRIKAAGWRDNIEP